jgi:hypothetical protein
MICGACRCPGPFRQIGLCTRCRAIAHRPKRTNAAPRTAKRWLAPEYHELRRALGLTPEQAVLRAEGIFRELRLIFAGRVILNWGIDNPYMAKHARRTLVSYIQRFHLAKAKNKPVQSVRRSIATRKGIAA